ncbi:hypothetical protein KDH_80150 [Dictyobacter sp. S3.2.2.5]|uniref:t-SNARE coiled-coil homology domain-containing protein n=1 Tax=Dictyobacter halimunensis TaxID=3026934 RepID=A0ABQ6G3T3_9CHLR|nr:hypothetical protein KDH_80150 [Dictyobacter sp. S3.2.2.5]
MEEENALIPMAEKSVMFYDDEIVTTLVAYNGQSQMYIPIRPICEHLGLSWTGQRERIHRDPVLDAEAKLVRLTRAGRGDPTALCLPLKFLNGWLFGINAARVKPELKEVVIRYQRECYEALYQAFQAETLQGAQSASQEITVSPSTTALEQIRDMGLAIAHLAEQQLEMEQRINARFDQTDARLNNAARLFASFDRRLGAVERRVEPAAVISDVQAAEISAKVKALAEALTAKDKSKNHYQSIFAELYRRFEVSSYKLIRQSQYQEVLVFLDHWRASFDDLDS